MSTIYHYLRPTKCLAHCFAIVAMLVGASHAPGQDEDETPLYLRPRFDRVVLNSGQNVDVQPLRFNGQRQVPTPKPTTGSIDVRPLEAESGAVKYSINWSDIARVDLFEDLILAEGKRLTAEGKFDEAFGYYAHLLKVAPRTRNLDQTINSYLQANAMEAFRQGQFDRALAILGSLYQRAPGVANMARAVDTVVDKIIEQYWNDRDFHAARLTLDVANSSFEGLPLTVVDKWTERFENTAKEQLAQAARLTNEKDYLSARDSIKQAVAVWPQIRNAEELLNRIQREHPIVRVGVAERAPRQPEFRLDGWASNRAAQLTGPQLASLRGYSTEGGVYQSPAATISVDDTGLGMTIELVDPPAGDELAVGLGASAVARRLIEATDPSHPTYNRVLADLIVEVRVEYPRTLLIGFSRPHVRPESLLELGLPPELGTASGQVIYEMKEYSDTIVRYQALRKQEGAIVEVHEIPFNNDDAAAEALMRGDIDILDRVAPWQLGYFEGEADVTVDSYQLPSLHVIVPTGRHPITSEREFRRALCFGINRQQILSKEILAGHRDGGFQVISGPFPAGVTLSDPIRYGYNSQIKSRDYDPRLAILLTSLAWTNAQKKQGVKKPGGDLPVLKLGHSSDPLARTACRSIATNLRPVLQLELIELTPEEMLNAKEKVDLKYVELNVWEPVTDARRLLGDDGLLGESSDFMSVALDRLDQATNWNEVRSRLYEIHNAANSDLPVIPLWQTTNYFAYRKSVLGIQPRPVRLYQNVSDWQIEYGGRSL